MGIAVGTNTPQGGDTGHGGETFIRMERLAGDITFHVNTLNKKRYLEIKAGGDEEAETLINMLQFAIDELKNLREFQGRK
jgi:hypothetical protein